MAFVHRDEVETFFPMWLTFSDGTVLDRLDPWEDERSFFVAYSKHDGQRWRFAQFFVPKQCIGRLFPWTPKEWAHEVAQAEKYDRSAPSGVIVA